LRSPHSPQVRDLAAALWISGGYWIAWLSDSLRNAGGDKQVTVNFDQRSMLQDIAGLLSYPSIRVYVLMMESTYNEDQEVGRKMIILGRFTGGQNKFNCLSY
jgi:hypothetical protein